MSADKPRIAMDDLVSLCKRRGFIFQSSEIYGGINGFWDYGPLGVELKRNIKDTWWRAMVQARDDIVGLDASIIMHPRVWEASGHIGGFQDPMQTCQVCKRHMRADQVWEGILESDWVKSLGRVIAPEPDTRLCTFTGPGLLNWASHEGKRLAPGLALVRNPSITITWIAERIEKEPGKRFSVQELLRYLATEQMGQTGPVTPCPHCGGALTEPRQFNLMFETHVGAVRSEENKTYLRPETAQGIFVQFDNVLQVSRQKIPFGIAQIGKAFRNEINPRNFTFRSREFEQMELEFFIKPGTDAEWHEYWVKERLKWYESIGLPAEHLHQYVYKKEELAHYASACVDVMYDFPFGTQELEGIAARGDYDLRRHQEFSGKSMEYFEPSDPSSSSSGQKYIPHVVEPSAGVDRIALAVLCQAYAQEWVPTAEAAGAEPRPAEPGQKPPQGFEVRTVMRFAPVIAPVKVAVFPLLKNKPELVAKARGVYDGLRRRWPAFWDVTGAIGRRYRRQDEVGTPFCITVDFQTLEDDTVTVRDRDTMKQIRAGIGELDGLLAGKLG